MNNTSFTPQSENGDYGINQIETFLKETKNKLSTQVNRSSEQLTNSDGEPIDLKPWLKQHRQESIKNKLNNVYMKLKINNASQTAYNDESD